ncbi:J domain-containing protein [Brevundimonas nasdae]|nr:J domain-containing protein [Brevundimonas nasdae]
MNHDPKGFYSRLGLSPDASLSEIKTAYRSLAKALHPDVNSDPKASERFTACSEAYAILGDPDKRAHYDSAAYEHAASGIETNEALEPISCSRCRKVTAQPRNVTFRSVVSVILTTITTPVQGIFCSDCAQKTAIKASITTGLFGWWGVPWGPILTIKEIVRNAAGGDRKPALDDRLAYYNAVAFASRGNFSLAHAIVRQVRGSTDERLALEALRLVDELERRGVPKNNPALKSGWKPAGRGWAIHGAALLGLPAAAGLAVVMLDGGSSYASPPRYSPTYTEPAPSQPLSPTNVPEAIPEPQVILASCDTPPLNGDEFARDGLEEDGHRITIKNGGSGDALVKIREYPSRKIVSTMFVKRGQQASFNDLPDGEYEMLFATGDVLDESCRRFSGDVITQRFPGKETFITQYEGNQIIKSNLTLTLYNVPGGNVSPQRVSEDEFNAG